MEIVHKTYNWYSHAVVGPGTDVCGVQHFHEQIVSASKAQLVLVIKFGCELTVFTINKRTSTGVLLKGWDRIVGYMLNP